MTYLRVHEAGGVLPPPPLPSVPLHYPERSAHHASWADGTCTLDLPYTSPRQPMDPVTDRLTGSTSEDFGERLTDWGHHEHGRGRPYAGESSRGWRWPTQGETGPSAQTKGGYTSDAPGGARDSTRGERPPSATCSSAYLGAM